MREELRLDPGSMRYNASVMRLWVGTVLICMGCSGAYSEGAEETGVGSDSGGAKGDGDVGGEGGSEMGGAGTATGGDQLTQSGGSSSGGASGGAVGDGGSPSGGDGSGGQGSGGEGSGGAPPMEIVLWSGSYSGFTVVEQGATFVSARIRFDGTDCPLGLGIQFEPGDAGTFNPQSAYDLSCANSSLAPVAEFGHEWELSNLPDIDYSEPGLKVRFTLNSFTASEWPVVGDADVNVSFLWEIFKN